ncbi:hypothetical protein ANO11243_025160 [Dothideomycetidae sp. 11243]|nr:hypothetical protein ANO11243_025160 [fungal sp. No.11243]
MVRGLDGANDDGLIDVSMSSDITSVVSIDEDCKSDLQEEISSRRAVSNATAGAPSIHHDRGNARGHVPRTATNFRSNSEDNTRGGFSSNPTASVDLHEVRESPTRNRIRKRAESPLIQRLSPFNLHERFVPTKCFNSDSRDVSFTSLPARMLTPYGRAVRKTPISHNGFSSQRRISRPKTSERVLDVCRTYRSRIPIMRGSASVQIQSRGKSYIPDRAPSHGSVFNVGRAQVTIDGVHSISDGQGGRVTSRTNAPFYVSDFFSKKDHLADHDTFRNRLAAALDFDLATRILASPTSSPASSSSTTTSPKTFSEQSTKWEHRAWLASPTRAAFKSPKAPQRLPARLTFCTVLDAPGLRDDYYCSLLAYSSTAQCLAVGLGSNVYFWSELHGVKTPENFTSPFSSHITSLAFSSEDGGKALLAIGRPCFDADHVSPVSCVAFAPRQIDRPSSREALVKTEMELLAVGDESGHVYLYAVEWPDKEKRDLHDWHGAMNVLVRLDAHSQQVCGFAWSIDNKFLASGGNDNCVCIFEIKNILSPKKNRRVGVAKSDVQGNSELSSPIIHPLPVSYPASHPEQNNKFPILPTTVAKHRILLSAAIKALSFAPFASTLLALGAGSNDRSIHFHHASSGAKLAAIDCAAQVTSLTWSKTRSEIAATFGFAQPEHRVRVAVYAWPACTVVVRIEWPSDDRALWAVSFPGGPEGAAPAVRGKRRAREGVVACRSRTRREGCLVVAASDASIKFHEVWSDEPGGARIGQLGGSAVLEDDFLTESLGDIIR